MFAFSAMLFVLHLSAVYLTALFCSAWLAGSFHHWVLPLVDPGNDTSTFQFLFSHLLVFTFIPAFAVGLINAKYRRKIALFVWIVPAIILTYKFSTFPTSLFQNRFDAAFHYYFGAGFFIGEFHNYQDLFTIVGQNADAVRGIDQLHITGPFYAGVGYSVAAWVGLRTDLNRKISETVHRWKERR
jgi:hypothetical protein